ncbi:MAG: tRNA pseudouridine(38-40) synthase TruA [Fulvivirga sp.]
MKHPNDSYYLVEIQYLGFRFHGWQSQPGVKTVQGMVERTLNYILPDRKLKVIGMSRTDAMVSANYAAFQLIARERIDEQWFLSEFQKNLPADIRAISMKPVEATFNIIQQPKIKEYNYLFSFGEKYHPFCAPFMANFHQALDVAQMQEAAKCFEGQHDFSGFCDRSNAQQSTVREVIQCQLSVNDEFTASFFPKKSYKLVIKSSGFLRYQIRYIMGAIVDVGQGALSVNDIREALSKGAEKAIVGKAPASGLVLQHVSFIE